MPAVPDHRAPGPRSPKTYRLLVAGAYAALGLGLAESAGCDERGDSASASAVLPAPTQSPLRFASSLLARAEEQPARRETAGFVVRARAVGGDEGALRSASRGLVAKLSPSGEGPTELELEDGTRFGFRRRGATGAARLEGGALVYGAPSDALETRVFAHGAMLEELFLVRSRELPLGYDLELGPELSVEQIDARSLRLVDARGRARAHLSAARGWDADGAPLELAFELDARGVRLEVLSEGPLPHLIDPAWSDATVPLKLRRSHTATLLPSGELLVAGGSTGDQIEASAELYDPSTGTSRFIAPLATRRAHHTATLLPDGRVLIAGGRDAAGALATTELYDPEDESFEPGPPMSEARSYHTAVLLDDDRVLVVGASSAQLFDPASDAFVAAGPLAQPFGFEVAGAKLADGRILLLGANQAGDAAEAQLFDPTSNGFVGTTPPTSFIPGGHSLTTLLDGRVLALGGCPCASTGGPTFTSPGAELFDASAAGGLGAFAPTGSVQNARLGHSATLLPSGKVLITGGDDGVPSPEQRNAELYDPATGSFALLPEQMSDPRGSHSATLLPSGDVLLLGGEQASAELYVDANAYRSRPSSSAWSGIVGRAYHTATTLLDGRVLLTGGELDPLVVDPPSAERFDPATGSSSATGPMLTQRKHHTATLLADGRVLVTGGDAGGPLASTELYDPSGAGSFVAGPALGDARSRHSATMLADGRVLIAGGVGASGPLATAQLYDPATDALVDTSGAMADALGEHDATRLADGRVLLVGPSSAQLYDPRTGGFSAASPPGVSHPNVRVSALPNGRALITGGTSFSGELYDPTSGGFVFTGSNSTARFGHTQIATATGQVLVIGGHLDTTLQPTLDQIDVYDPLSGGFYPARPLAVPRSGAAATLLRNGELLVTGGYPCLQLCFPQPTPSFDHLALDAGAPASRPVVSTVPATVRGGESAPVTGLRLRGLERSDGGSSASSAELPIAIFRPLSGGAAAFGALLDVDDDSATWQVPVTGFTGPGLFQVAVGGVLSDAVALRLEPALDGVACALGAQCESGSCADGVCCDTACTGACEGCTAARKGGGLDGACGAVPPALDPNDACELSQGAPCLDDGGCATGLCVDGVCCLSECTGQCEACDVPGSVGTCVPVLGVPHQGRAACDASPPADACAALLCDGVERSSCAKTVGPCEPYACGEAACLESCEGDAQCASGYHCEEGACVPGRCDGGSIATTPDGQEVDCAPYRCLANGSCRASCGEVSHCADPYACDFDGRCVPRPAPDTLTSCSCELAGGPAGVPSSAWALALAVVVVARRRRRASGSALVAALLCFGAHAGSARAQPSPQASATASAPQPSPGAAAPVAPQSSESGPEVELAKAEARERFEKGIALVKQQAWSAALAEFLESRRLYATRTASQNAAYCLRQLGRFDESLDLYEAVLREHTGLDDAKKREISTAVSELRALVGSIDLEAGEPGSAIVVDGRERGFYPPEGPLRVAAGSHVVRVYKQGFAPFEARVDVAGRGVARLDATLVPLVESGTLEVSEATGATLEVYVDNIKVGSTPFEGQLAVGAHVVVLRGEGGLGTPPTSAPVELSRKTSLRLRAVKLDALLRVEPTPAAALVVIDGVPVGRGTWEGALPSGEHRIDVSADGFLPKRLELALSSGPPVVRKVELLRDEDDARWRIPSKITLEASGSLGLFPSFLGNVGDGCDEACSSSFGTGALATLHVAYELGSGLGFGLTGGFLHASQTVEGRLSSVRPVGLPPREGRVTDELSLTGALVMGHASYHLESRFPVLMRLGVGALFGSMSDRRVGSFGLDDGFTYQAGPVAQSTAATYLAIDPELRVAYPLSESLELSLGLHVAFFVALERPRWDSDREVDAAVDGIGAFEGEDLTGPLWVLAAPGLGLRYAF